MSWVMRKFSLQLFGTIVFLMAVDTLISSNLSTRKNLEVVFGEIYILIEITIALVILTAGIILVIRNNYRYLRWLFLGYNGLLTIAIISDVVSLVQTLPQQKVGTIILGDAFFIWASNLVIFGLWYWMIDGGGPELRNKSVKKIRNDLMFPQEQQDLPGWEKWKPHFLDYFFLSFYSSMAFTPTDTLILSGKMKFLLMLQSLISLVVLAMIGARAINLIG